MFIVASQSRGTAMDKERWCPTQRGKMIAYEPQWLNDGEWCAVPTKPSTSGVPAPMFGFGAAKMVGLCGYAEAMALAWAYAASAHACGEEIEARVAEYEVEYDIKAKSISSPKDES